MSLESTLERIADALEGLVAKAGAAPKNADAAEPAKPRGRTPAAAKAPKVSIDDLKVLLSKLIATEPKDDSIAKAKEILQRFGVKKLGDLEPDQFEECKRIVEGVLDGTLQPNGEPATEDLM